MTLYRRGFPDFEESDDRWMPFQHWLQELLHAGVLVEVEVDAGAFADELRDQQADYGPLWTTLAQRLVDIAIKDVEDD